MMSNPRRAQLIVGDVIVFLVFAALGRSAHSMGSALDDVVGTAFPFLIAWAVIAPFTGAYGPGATGSAKQAAGRTLVTWLFAFPLGLLVRVPIVGRVSHWSFALVAGIFTLLLLTVWRAVFARVTA